MPTGSPPCLARFTAPSPSVRRARRVSVGASFRESALILQALGAREGVNLDGGGSTTMTVGDDLVTTPSAVTGERPIGDAVVLLAE